MQECKQLTDGDEMSKFTSCKSEYIYFANHLLLGSEHWFGEWVCDMNINLTLPQCIHVEIKSTMRSSIRLTSTVTNFCYKTLPME